MKKTISVILCLALLCLSLSSCENQKDAYDLLQKFVSAYGAEGVIYSPKIFEGEAGYIPSGLVEKIFVFSGRFPDNFALFLSGHTESFSECGFFVCNDANMLSMVEEMCLERIRLLSKGEKHAFVKKSGTLVFYSTMQNRDRAERLFSEIIR